MLSIMKEAPVPVKDDQEFISFLRNQGRVFGFHAGDYDHVVCSLLPRAMLAQLVGNYPAPGWLSACGACDQATLQEQI